MNCPDCSGMVVFPGGWDGEAVCCRCGLVLNEPLSLQAYREWQPEWFSRWDGGDSETLKEWLTELRIISQKLNLPSFPYREEAARIIRLKSAELFKSQRFGKNKREAVTALIYIVLKKYNKMRALKDICQTLSLDYNLVNKHVWAMYEITDKRQPLSVQESPSIHYLRTFAWNLTSDSQVIHAAETLLRKIHRGLGGNPISLAAGALYHVCKTKAPNVSKDKIGKAFKISSRTVYSGERKIRTIMEQKTPPRGSLDTFSSFTQGQAGNF